MRINVLLLCFLSLSSFAEMPHPDSIVFEPLTWEVPTGAQYRQILSNGTPFYYAQDTTVPQFSLRFTFRTGSYYESGTPVLHAMALRNGGSHKMSPKKVDSLLDFYALSYDVNSGKTQTTITISGLSSFYNQAEEIVTNLLLKPAFDKKRVKQNKELLLQKIAHQFDNAEPVLGAAWKKVLHPYNEISRVTTVKDIKKISVRSMQSMSRKYHKYMMDSAEVYVAFAGDIPRERVEETIGKIIPENRVIASRELLDLASKYKPQVLLVHKPINQAYVVIGQPAIQRPDTNYYPLMLFNQILGGGGFNSRLMTRVRSNKGLTYSIYSRIESNYTIKGSFSTIFFTMSNRINEALFLTLDVINETLSNKQDINEVNMIKSRLIQALPSYFRTKRDIVNTYLDNEFDKRADDHYTVYEEKLRAITIKDIENAKKNVLNPEQFSIVIVGDTSALLAAPSYKERSLKDLNPKVITENELLMYQNEKPETN